MEVKETVDPSVPQNEAPEDTRYLCYITYFICGLSVVLPFSSVVNASQALEERLVDLPVADAFLTHFSVLYMVTKLIFLAGVLFMKRGRKVMARNAMIGSLVLATSVAILLIFSIWEQIPPNVFYAFLLILSIAISLSSVLLESGISGIIAHFPPRIMQSHFIGQGSSGILAALLAIILEYAISGKDKRRVLMICQIGMALVVTVASFWLQYFARKTPFYVHYESKVGASENTEYEQEANEKQEKLHEIVWKISDLLGTAFMSSFVSLCIYPYFIVHTMSTDCSGPRTDWKHRIFRPLAFLVGSSFDLIGRSLPAIPILFRLNIPFLPLAFSKFFILIGLFMGNVKIKGRQLPFKPILPSDVLFFLLLATSAIVSGYLSTMAVVAAPMRVHQGVRSKATNLLVLASIYGAVSGSFTSALIAYFLRSISVELPIT